MSYSLRDVVPDGLLGPSERWVLHLVKLAQHAAPAFAVVCAWSAIGGRPDFFLAGFASGLVVYCVLVVRKRIRMGKSTPVNQRDWVFDASFPLGVTALGALAQGYWLEAIVLAVVSIALYAWLHPWGVP